MNNTNDLRTNPQYFEKDPKKKNYAWGSDMISVLRRSWKPIVDPHRSREGMEILMGKQDMKEIVKSFKEGSSFKEDVDIVAIPAFEKVRNILVSEFKKGEYMPQVNAMDPAAQSEKKKDLTMLANRHMVEGPVSQMNAQVGQPPYKVPRSQYSSNVDKFDEMGLDSTKPQDLSFFRDIYQMLDHEIAATTIVQSLYEYNEFDQHIEDLVNDVLAKKAIAFQVFESPQSGEIKQKYLIPDQVKWIRGNRRDGKDATCLGFEKTVSVREWLEMASGWFVFERDHNVLLQAVRYSSAVDWYALTYSSRTPEGFSDPTRNEIVATDDKGNIVAGWSAIQSYQVSIGYIEWKSVDGLAKKVNKKNKIYYPIDYMEDVNVHSTYQKEVTEVQNTYKSYFVATGMYSQFMWNFGPLFHQITQGAADEYSNYSISVWTGTGQTAIEISRPLIKTANFAFYKLLWGIYESKPNVEVYNIDSLINMLGQIGPTPSNGAMGVEPGRAGQAKSAPTTGLDSLTDLISFMRKSLIRLYSSGDQKMGGDGKPHYVEPGGIDPIAIAMQSVIDWTEAKISSNLGINALREGYTPDPKDGYKLNVEATKQSRNATYYIPDAITYVMKTVATNSMVLSQDCIALGGKGKNFLLDLVGKSNVTNISSIGKVPLHRYGMFIQVYNAEEKKAETRQDAQMAFGKGEIQYQEYMLIKEVPDYKKANMMLAFFREKGVRLEKEMAQAKFQQDMQIIQAKGQAATMPVIAAGQWKLKEMNVWGEWYMRAHQSTNDAKIQAEQMRQDHAKDDAQNKADAKIKEINAKTDAELQQPLQNTAQ